jgi:hypothetical protein
MSHEIVAQPGLSNVECQVIITALNYFRDALRAPVNPDPENPANVSHAVKLEQYCHVADSVIGKIVRNAVKMGKVPDARNIKPGGGIRRL